MLTAPELLRPFALSRAIDLGQLLLHIGPEAIDPIVGLEHCT